MTRIVSLLFHDVYVNDAGESGFCSPAANRYKLTSDEFDAQLAGLDTLGVPAALPGNGGRFFVSVDDGGSSYYSVIAPKLEKRGWRGACFVPTDFIGRPGFLDDKQIRELDARGHLIGSHSASHPTRFSACTADEMHDEWARSRKKLEDLLDHPVTAASLPGGYFSRAVARTASEAGFTLLFTSEPQTTIGRAGDCIVAGRFTVRAGSRPDLSLALVSSTPWTRLRAWASWNAKGVVKPILGSSYPHVADLIRGR